MDIDDILADLSRGELASTVSAAQDHQELTRFWIAERAAPDILRYPIDLMTRVMQRIALQIEKIEDLTATGAENNQPQAHAPSNTNLILSILQTDLSRTQFMVRSLLRQRLAKLTKFSMHYLTLDDKGSLLSEPEQAFLQNHQALLANFYNASFLSAFPANLQRLDDTAGGLNMVQGPDTKQAVFVRCLAERWTNDPGVDDEADALLSMQEGDVWIVRWEDVRKGVEKGKLELL